MSTPDARQRDAVISICLMAAVSDGHKGQHERERIREVAEGFAETGGGTPPAMLYQRVVLKQSTPETEAAALTTPELRSLAYEMALCVCDADGQLSPSEEAFLERLRGLLGIDGGEARALRAQADEIVSFDLESADAGARATGSELSAGAGAALSAGAGAGAALAAGAGGALAAGGAEPAGPDAEIDSMIRNYSILTAALELMPQNLATMAIIPLQMKMVYRIGKRFGFSLDRGHIKDFMLAAGVGATSQMVEGLARKVVGDLGKGLGKALLGKGVGKMIGSVGKTATGAAVTFASTYALGQVARQYYAGGRRLSAVDLKAIFQQQSEAARSAYEKLRPEVERRAGSLRPADLPNLLKA